MEERQAGVRAPRGLTHSNVEMITAAIIFGIGAVMMIDTYRIGAGWAFDGPEAGYFPFRTGAIIAIASVIIFFRTLLGKSRNQKAFVSWERFEQVLKVLVPTLIYVLVTQIVGIYVASAVFIGLFMRMLDKSSWLKTVLVSVGVTGALFWMFEVQFMVPLPKGPLEALFGY
jgi:hypothetical protein